MESKKSQLNCRFIYRPYKLMDLNLAQVYLELSNLIQASGKIQAADYCLYCYFDGPLNSEDLQQQQCKAGLHIVGWDTGLQSEALIQDFSKIDFARYPILTPTNPQELLESYQSVMQKSNDAQVNGPWRLTSEFQLEEQTFEIKTYLDLISL